MKADVDLPPVLIYLHKILPIGAGLGGGSADAAFTIKSFNDLFLLNLSETQMENYARQLGSDCAFFIQNKAKFCLEKGDVFEDTDVSLKDVYITLVYPNVHISSKEAYAQIKPVIPETKLKDILKLEPKEWKNLLKNDFEVSVFAQYPHLEKIKDQLYSKGAFYASMTGSGSAFYALSDEKINIKNIFPDDYLIWQGMLD